VADKDVLAFFRWYGTLGFIQDDCYFDWFFEVSEEGNLYISTNDEELNISANCSDTFAWGSADCEPITEDSMPLVIQTARDLFEVLHPIADKVTDRQWLSCWADLYAARVRSLRPQGAAYKRYPKEVWHLFDAAGPERETGLGNPYKPGQYK